MSFPRYPSYKDSGVEWLGEVPEHWDLIPVWLLFKLGRGRVISHDEIFENPGEYPVYSSQTEHDGVMGRIGSYDFNGDYLTWTTDGANAGTVFRRKGMFNCTNVCGTLEAKNKPVDLDYALHAIALSTGFYVRQDINPKLMNNVMAKIAVLYPPYIEQQTIASFLRRETAKIDALVAEQEQLIALLKEKRQAVISHAVTKGLDPTVPMKDSGIEWLGEVPAHWSVCPLRWYASCQSGDGISGSEIEAEADENFSVPSIGGNGIMGYTNQANTFSKVLAIGRVGALCGNVHLINPPAWISDNALMLSASDQFDLLFLEHVLRSRNLNEIASKTAQPLITGTQVRDQRIPLPPMQEQIMVVEFLISETAKLDTLTAEAQRGIDLLKERRSALISAAVTGKIDVRGYHAQPQPIV